MATFGELQPGSELRKRKVGEGQQPSFSASFPTTISQTLYQEVKIHFLTLLLVEGGVDMLYIMADPSTGTYFQHTDKCTHPHKHIQKKFTRDQTQKAFCVLCLKRIQYMDSDCWWVSIVFLRPLHSL